MPALKNRHRFAVLTAFVCALALVGCGKNEDAPKAEGDPKPADAPKLAGKKDGDSTMDDLKDAKPDVTYTAMTLFPELRKDYDFLRKKHTGKVVELTGVVTSYGWRGLLFLEGGPLRISDDLACLLDEKEPWKKVFPGQSVTLRWAVTQSNIRPPEWQIVGVSGRPAPEVSAETFVKERKANFDAFQKKYGSHTLVVTGVLVEAKIRQDSDPDPTELVLEAAGGEKLECRMPPASTIVPISPTQQAALKPGQKVKLIGTLFGLDPTVLVLLEPAP